MSTVQELELEVEDLYDKNIALMKKQKALNAQLAELKGDQSRLAWFRKSAKMITLSGAVLCTVGKSSVDVGVCVVSPNGNSYADCLNPVGKNYTLVISMEEAKRISKATGQDRCTILDNGQQICRLSNDNATLWDERNGTNVASVAGLLNKNRDTLNENWDSITEFFERLSSCSVMSSHSVQSSAPIGAPRPPSSPIQRCGDRHLSTKFALHARVAKR